jgi:proline iminopeptidase
MFSLTESFVGSVIFALLVLCYVGYKKFREPFYKPGNVVEAMSSRPEEFDKQDLVQYESEQHWRMPDGIDIYHFPLENQSKTYERPILALHGGPAIAPEKPWKICKILPNVLLYHARGCGNSTHPFRKFPTPGNMWPGMQILEETLGIGAQIADVERIRRRLGVEKLDLVGHSFGGFIATLYAAEFPQRVRSMVLLVPAAVLQLPSPKGEVGDLFVLVRQKLEERGNHLHLKEFDVFMKRYLNFSSLPNETDDSLALRQNEFAVHFMRADKGIEGDLDNLEPGNTGGMACYATFLSMGIEHDYTSDIRELLKDSKFPVAIVHGEEDMVPVGMSRKYLNLFPPGSTTFEVVPGVGHFIFDHPRCAEIVKNTIDRVGTNN